MQNKQFLLDNCQIRYSIFNNNKSNGEIHAIASLEKSSLSFLEQLDIISNSIKNFLTHEDCKDYQITFVRILLSDAANQAEIAKKTLKEIVGQAAVSFVEQAPLNYSKIAVLFFMRQGCSISQIDDFTSIVKSKNFSHYYSVGVVSDIADTYAETNLQLSYIEKLLKDNNFSIAENCVRTWFYVQNIDVNYPSVVLSRKENFNNNGLTIDTHYITSTGIAGRHSNKDVTSILDAYCVGGLKESQMGFLYASNYLNRTSEYGVTFERGTYVDYKDRRHILISGTASIDNKGNVFAVGDIKAQTYRMIENVLALLDEAKANKNDISHIVCYLRDIADYPLVSQIFKEEFKDIPYVITLASVCRTSWLIEMECMAITSNASQFGEF